MTENNIQSKKWISKIAWHVGIRNEIPNQELAKELANTENKEGIKEISEYLFDKNKSISSDCIKVLYEIGYIKPELIADYANIFLQLLKSKNNRMVWGAMIALSTIAHIETDILYNNINLIIETTKNGSVITQVAGINTFAGLAAANTKCKEELLPVLFDYLENSRPVDFAKRTETILPIIHSSEERELIERIIELKQPELSQAQQKKLKTVMNKYYKKLKS